MTKRFNITGSCSPKKHYMADVSAQLQDTYTMIENGEYFIINRPRQYGKTTTLYTMARTLRTQNDYVVFNISFEGIGNSFFADEKYVIRLYHPCSNYRENRNEGGEVLYEY